jgi:hypothetical protein
MELSREGRGMQDFFWWEKDHEEDLGRCEDSIKIHLKGTDLGVWTGFIWLKTRHQ